MKLAIVLALMMTVSVSALWADYPGSLRGVVGVNYMEIDKVRIDTSTGKIEKAASSAATATDDLYIASTEAHSLAVTIVATQTVSCDVEVKGSFDGGANFHSFTTPQKITCTANGTEWDAVNLPACPLVRVEMSSDATYPVTFTAVVLNKY